MRIAETYHAWRGEPEIGAYEDVPGFCKVATLEEIRVHHHVLTPGRYVGAATVEEDDVPFEERFAEAEELSAFISLYKASRYICFTVSLKKPRPGGRISLCCDSF